MPHDAQYHGEGNEDLRGARSLRFKRASRGEAHNQTDEKACSKPLKAKAWKGLRASNEGL